jgi:murein DD-endopeptidase MepM/ murein hydrolase activator NlpD
MRKFLLGLTTCLILSLIVVSLHSSGYFSVTDDYLSASEAETITVMAPEPYVIDQEIEEAPQVQEPTLVFGIPADSFLVINDKIRSGQSLSHILQKYNVSSAQLDELNRKAKDVFNLRQIRANKPYTLLCENDAAQTARYFIYQPSNTEYVVFALKDSLQVYKAEKEIQTVERTVAGTIKSSLYVAMAEAGCSPGLINHFADIYSWKVNFAAVQPGDQFKLIFEERLLDGEPIGHGTLKAAYFEHRGRPMYAIHYGEGTTGNYYDQDGNSMRRALLKEPLEYTRVSSRFSMKRFHPVQKRVKPHLGTDFAAPHGTPIRTVGDGVVVEAGFTKGNGNYVKIKHDQTYSTQYLHMSKFAKGIRKGTRVSMGQTIGYVGSTGLATGPHLCFRFWKNGKQVDPFLEKLPPAKSIDKQHKEQFDQLSQSLITQLGNIGPEQLADASDESSVYAGM